MKKVIKIQGERKRLTNVVFGQGDRLSVMRASYPIAEVLAGEG